MRTIQTKIRCITVPNIIIFFQVVESESDVDEQRALNRRSFSYEHIDGVGDDASTDSRVRYMITVGWRYNLSMIRYLQGRTDGDTTEDTGKENEEGDDGMSTEGETTDGGGKILFRYLTSVVTQRIFRFVSLAKYELLRYNG